MPLYFFHQRTHGAVIADPEGGEFPDVERAREEAIRCARQLLAAAVLRGVDPAGTAFEIADAQGHRLLTVSFRDVLPPSLCAQCGGRAS